MQQQHFMATTQVLKHLISVTERTLKTSGAYQSFGPGGNRGGFQHHDRGGFHHHDRGKKKKETKAQEAKDHGGQPASKEPASNHPPSVQPALKQPASNAKALLGLSRAKSQA
eukprot:15328678-Ditylum_brightwellii.AAC.1